MEIFRGTRDTLDFEVLRTLVLPRKLEMHTLRGIVSFARSKQRMTAWGYAVAQHPPEVSGR